MTFLLGFAKVLTALACLTGVVFTVFFLIHGPRLAALSTAALGALFGVFVVRDVRTLLAKRTS